MTARIARGGTSQRARPKQPARGRQNSRKQVQPDPLHGKGQVGI